MTDAPSALVCPECGGPITVEQLGEHGACPDCSDTGPAVASGPGEEAGPEVPPRNDGAPPAGETQDGGLAGGPPSSPQEVLVEVVGLIGATVEQFDRVREYSWMIEPDELCQALGTFLDGVSAAGHELLGFVEAGPDAGGEE